MRILNNLKFFAFFSLIFIIGLLIPKTAIAFDSECGTATSPQPSNFMNCNSSALGPGTYVWSNNTCYRLTGGSCTDNTSGRAGTCQTQEGTGDCSVPCSANFGLACNVNACGTAGGTYDCNDVCSGLTPAIPYTVGADCNRNACGGTGVIEDQCAGTCSASAPACVPTSTPVPVSVSTPTPTTAPGVAAPTPVPVICSPDAIRYVCTATSC